MAIEKMSRMELDKCGFQILALPLPSEMGIHTLL